MNIIMNYVEGENVMFLTMRGFLRFIFGQTFVSLNVCYHSTIDSSTKQ